MNEDAHIRSVIQEMVRRLVEGYGPKKIILFGSYAYGQPDEESDIDLLIVKQTDERFLDRMDTVRRLVRGAHRYIPFEPVVFTPEELEERFRMGDRFIAEILRKGEILYAA